ncbi:MAG: 50S ribosomal protein L22 [Sandaracinaceae bacterium]|nr:50S ribosomal protein L22 [Sandaracinaceae bacterium]
MEATAIARFSRISPRKARTIANLVRGKNVTQAVNELKFTQKAAAAVVAKLLDSAIANARLKDASVDLDALYVKTIFADKAATAFMRRWRPRAMGRATQITKGLTHITLIVADRAEA